MSGLRPTAFVDVAIDELLAKGIRTKGVAWISAMETRLPTTLLWRMSPSLPSRFWRDIVNEVVEAGGPSNVSQNDLATLLERRFQSSGKRRHVPVAAMRLLPPIVRPFDEVSARLITLGLYFATHPTPFAGWQASAERFGVAPRTVETHIAEMA